MVIFFIIFFIIAAATLLAIYRASFVFNLNATNEVSHMPRSNYGSHELKKKLLKSLPKIVEKWLLRSGVVGRPFISRVFLKQKGHMRTKINGNWMALTAEQHFTVREPAFIWIAKIKAAPLIHIAGRDKYQDGRGNMLIKVLSLFKIADATGRETDQGSLLRYLAEIVWFPSAALSDYIIWKKSGPLSATATMTYMGTSASGEFKFDSEGDVVSFEAHRYYERKGGATLEPWLITVDNNGFRVFEGIRIPAKASITWKLEEGDFEWLDLEVTEVYYNR